MPLTVSVLGTEMDLTPDLTIQTNPVYGGADWSSSSCTCSTPRIPTSAMTTRSFLTTPNIHGDLGTLADSVIKTLLEELAGFIGDLKDEFLGSGFFDLTIPGIDRNIGSLLGDPEAFLNVDTNILDYLETVRWINAILLMTTSYSFRGQRRNQYLDHLDRPEGLPGDPLDGCLARDRFSGSSRLLHDGQRRDRAEHLGERAIYDQRYDPAESGHRFRCRRPDAGCGPEPGLRHFRRTVVRLHGRSDAGERSFDFDFNEFSFRASVNVDDIDLGASYDAIDVGLSTNAEGEAHLNLGGSVRREGGEFIFDHAEDGAGTPFANNVSLSLPLYLTAGSFDGLLLGTLSFADTDFYDGELEPGFRRGPARDQRNSGQCRLSAAG